MRRTEPKIRWPRVLPEGRKENSALAVTIEVLIGTFLLGQLAACGATGIGSAAPRAVSGLAARATVRPAGDAYYAGVATLQGKALLVGLNKLVRSHHKVYEYDQSRDFMFAQVDDIANTNTVIDVYCGRTGKGVIDRTSAFHRGLNTEHSWPQSMGAKELPARSDMHHLFPTDSGTNSMRNNNPYGVPQQVSETLPDFLGDGQHSRFGQTNGQTFFEPRPGHKGDCARAMLYFFTRYAVNPDPKVPISLANFRKEFQTLWRWHFQDPVSAHERTRNEAIYRLQGNRNPFIDHPEYLARIGQFSTKGMEGSLLDDPSMGIPTLDAWLPDGIDL